MWSQFLFEIGHFAISLFAALILFATFLLYFDAWQVGKRFGGLMRAIGFLILSASYLISGSILEASILTVPMISMSKMVTIQLLFRNVGFALILLEQASEKMQSRPKERLSLNAAVLFSIPSIVVHFLSPLLSFLIAILYTLKALVGLERHVKPAASAFFLFALSELLAALAIFRGTTNVTLFQMLAPFGPVWIIQHVLLLLAAFILGKWVSGYLLKQFQPQLFLLFTTLILVIFLITTTVFTSLLLKNIQDETLNQLENDARVLEYALDSKRTEEIADVQAIAQNPEIEANVASNSKDKLGILAEQFLLSKKYSSLLIIDDNGQVIARGEDKDNIGTFLNEDALVKRARLGESVGGVTTTEGVLAPVIALRAAAPIKNREEIIGVVVIGTTIDNTFVDGIRKATGLQASLYGNNVLSATTLLAADGTTRLTGITENNPEITERVLVAGQNYKGGMTIGNTLYFAADVPLFDINNTPVGMIFVGREQIGVLQAASRSIELTFIATAIMLVLSVIPSFFIARYITQQLR